MCCIIKVSQKFLEKNYFACSKIILWNLYNWMYSGKLTFSTPSTHKKNQAKCWREKKKYRANAYFKKTFMVKLMG